MRKRLTQVLLLGSAALLMAAFLGAPAWCASGAKAEVDKGRVDEEPDQIETDSATGTILKVPVAVFSELEYNAGDVRQGTPIEHTFVVKNEGNAPLNILSAKPG